MKTLINEHQSGEKIEIKIVEPAKSRFFIQSILAILMLTFLFSMTSCMVGLGGRQHNRQGGISGHNDRHDRRDKGSHRDRDERGDRGDRDDRHN